MVEGGWRWESDYTGKGDQKGEGDYIREEGC